MVDNREFEVKGAFAGVLLSLNGLKLDGAWLVALAYHWLLLATAL